VHWLKNGNSIGVEKFKTWWYIILRVIRQIILNPKNSENFDFAIRKTLLKRNRDFMHLPEGYIFLWHGIGVNFCKWMVESRISMSSVGITSANLGMGTLWQRFLSETGTNTDFCLTLPEEVVKSANLENFKFSSIRTPNSGTKTGERKLLVLMQGIPGIGKTFLAPHIVSALSPKKAVWLEQDQFSGANAGKDCLEKCTEYMKGEDAFDVVVLTRNNAELDQYEKYLKR
jgi:hypothetical protein